MSECFCRWCVFRDECEETLSVEVMVIIGRVESLQKYVRQADYTFYNILVDILMPDVLRPVPSTFHVVDKCCDFCPFTFVIFTRFLPLVPTVLFPKSGTLS